MKTSSSIIIGAAFGWALAASSSAAPSRLDIQLRQLLFGKAVVAEAKKHLGKPYLWGGKTGEAGFDCSGYTAAVYGALGVPLPPGAQSQLMQGASVPPDALQPGDLLFFHGRGSPFHVGIYQGSGRFLHAPGTGKKIQSTALEGAWTTRRWIAARRHAPPDLKPSTTPQREKRP